MIVSSRFSVPPEPAGAVRDGSPAVGSAMRTGRLREGSHGDEQVSAADPGRSRLGGNAPYAFWAPFPGCSVNPALDLV